MGLSICYDLRFPGLYRALADRGAAVLAIPAAFTVSTGEAHWHVLMRARAIETQCHVVAAAQCGTHGDGRQRSEEHTSELQSLMRISYAVFCLKKKTTIHTTSHNTNITRTNNKYTQH